MTDWNRINEKREAAERARRIGRQLTRPDDREHVFQFADELDAQADALQAATGEPSEVPQVTRPQQQMQQQRSQEKHDSPTK